MAINQDRLVYTPRLALLTETVLIKPFYLLGGHLLTFVFHSPQESSRAVHGHPTKGTHRMGSSAARF